VNETANSTRYHTSSKANRVLIFVSMFIGLRSRDGQPSALPQSVVLLTGGEVDLPGGDETGDELDA